MSLIIKEMTVTFKCLCTMTSLCCVCICAFMNVTRHRGYIGSPCQEYWIKSLLSGIQNQSESCLIHKIGILSGTQVWGVDRGSYELAEMRRVYWIIFVWPAQIKQGFFIPNCFTTSSHKTLKLRLSLICEMPQSKGLKIVASIARARKIII